MKVKQLENILTNALNKCIDEDIKKEKRIKRLNAERLERVRKFNK